MTFVFLWLNQIGGPPPCLIRGPPQAHLTACSTLPTVFWATYLISLTGLVGLPLVAKIVVAGQCASCIPNSPNATSVLPPVMAALTQLALCGQ
jgi:hypothetical protein